MSFCVYITIYRGALLPPFYIGYSSLHKVQQGYQGSVASAEYKNIWRQERRTHPYLFETRIISLHETRQKAFDKECLIQHYLKAHMNPLYINRNIGGKHFYRPGTFKHSEATKKAASLRGIGRRLTQEAKDKISKANSGPRSKKHCESISRAKLGKKRKPFTEETRRRMRESQQRRRANSLNNL